MAKHAVAVDSEKCIGCGMCEELAKEIFLLAADGKARVKKKEVDEKALAEVQDAERNCPVQGIHVKKK